MKYTLQKLFNLVLSVAIITLGVAFCGWAVAAFFGLNESDGTGYGTGLGVLIGLVYGRQEWRNTPAR